MVHSTGPVFTQQLHSSKMWLKRVLVRTKVVSRVKQLLLKSWSMVRSSSISESYSSLCSFELFSFSFHLDTLLTHLFVFLFFILLTITVRRITTSNTLPSQVRILTAQHNHCKSQCLLLLLTPLTLGSKINFPKNIGINMLQHHIVFYASLMNKFLSALCKKKKGVVRTYITLCNNITSSHRLFYFNFLK